MKTAQPTTLGAVREFFRQRSLIFEGDSFGLRSSRLVEGAIWDLREVSKGKPRRTAKIVVVWQGRTGHKMILRWNGPEEARDLNRLANDMAKAIGENIFIERESADVIYLPMRHEDGAAAEAKERRKGERINILLVTMAFLLLLGLLLFGEYAVPILRQRGVALSESVVIVRAFIFLVFKT